MSNSRAPLLLLLLSATTLMVATTTCRADPDPVQDFCVAAAPASGHNTTSTSTYPGFPCKPTSSVVSDDFFFAAHARGASTDNPMGVGVTPGNVEAFGGLNTLGLSINRVDLAPGGVNPLHSHPRSAELVHVEAGVNPIVLEQLGSRITSMEMEAAGGGKLNVVLFPWLAFGHMIPYMELAKRLAARVHAVTFLSTPRNVARLPPVPADLSPHVRLVALPTPVVDGLPDGAESTADVPPEKHDLLKKAVHGHAASFAAFLADAVAGGSRPDWVVIDFCHKWVPAIAHEHKVP